LACPICQKRKAKRPCPARAESICTVCCGTEREVTIDCPLDCPYLMASREYDATRQQLDRPKLPFPDVEISLTFLRKQGKLLEELNYAICDFAAEHREVVDADVLAALQSLAEAYRTLTSGIYYENPPVHPLQRGVYEELKTAVADFKKDEAQRQGMTTTRDGDIRDVLIFLTQLGATRSNGRPKGRAHLDFLRGMLPEEEFQKASSNLVLPY
jgi:hypothetical protein